MTTSLILGKHYDAFVESQLASGRYTDASEVVRDALRLLEERERRLAALGAALQPAIAAADAGQFEDAESVFDELEAELDAMQPVHGE